MTLGTDILQAVQSGGMANWRPKCEIKEKRGITRAKAHAFEKLLDELLVAIGTEQLTVAQLKERTGWSVELIRHRLGNLMDRKKVRRTTGKQPYLFFRANS